jgi:tetratricopeptide (TPR) repeat protein
VEYKHARLWSIVALVILSGAAPAQDLLRTADTVSAQELLHPPSRKSLDAFVAARKLSDKGAHQEAAEKLEKAVELSPYYSDAWINLAAQHLYLSRYDEALRELTRAHEIAGPSPVLLSDMAFAEFELGHFAEGLQSVRDALRLDPSYARAHYILGAFLVRDRRTRTEGIAHLERAASALPAAQGELERVRNSPL